MQKRKLGKNGLDVPALGLGCMGMSISYGEPNDEESIATIHRARDLGVNLLVTSDAYGNGVNEELDRESDQGPPHRFSRRHQVRQSRARRTRGAATAPALSGGHPDYVPQACDKSLKRLGVDHDRHLRPAPRRCDACRSRRRSARCRGSSSRARCAISRCRKPARRRSSARTRCIPITALETEYSLWSRDVEKEILPTCRELGIGFMAYAPLGRGFLTATIKTLDALLPKDRRRDHPRFDASNLERNRELLKPLEDIAAEKHATPAQVALAWLLAQGDDIVPIPGTKRRKYLEENCAAVDLELTADEIAALSERSRSM